MDNYTYDNTTDNIAINKTIIMVRSISCGVSLLPCLFLMVLYIILCLQTKFNICVKNKKENQNYTQKNSLIEQEGENRKIKTKNNKIGLGSHYMFFLILSNFLGSLFEFLFYFYYTNMIENKKTPKEINDDNTCKFYGFAHNFFDLLAVCWTTMLTYLFYCSTNLMSEILFKDKKYLIIGFLYSLLSCFIFCVIPIFLGCYGFASYYCSFQYSYFEHKSDEIISDSFRYSFVAMTTVNSVLNIFWLWKTNKYYSKKLKLLKKNNKKEYKLILIYVWVFRIFPIVLIISRICKGTTRVIFGLIDSQSDNSSESKNMMKLVFGYFNGITFASNGFFNSIACVFFFKGVFNCGSSNTSSEVKKEEMMITEKTEDENEIMSSASIM